MDSARTLVRTDFGPVTLFDTAGRVITWRSTGPNSHFRLHQQTEKALASVDRIAMSTTMQRSAYEQRNGERLARLQDIRDRVKGYLDETDEMVDPDMASALKGACSETQKAIRIIQTRMKKSYEVTKFKTRAKKAQDERDARKAE